VTHTLWIAPRGLDALAAAQEMSLAGAKWKWLTRLDDGRVVTTVTVSMPPLHPGLIRAAAEDACVIEDEEESP